MKQLLTERGPYFIFHAENGTLAGDYATHFRAAAAGGAPLIYADEEVSMPGGRLKPVQKPDWSPDTLRACNYVGSPFAASAALCAAAGPPQAHTPAARYAFLLRLAACNPTIRHIPHILFTGPAEPPCTDPKIVSSALRHARVHAQVTPGQLPGSFCVRYPVPDGMQVACVVVGTGCGVDAVRTTLESIVCNSTYPDTKLVVCDGSPIAQRREAYYDALKGFGAATVFRAYDAPNVPKLINLAAENTLCDALLILPAGVALRAHDCIERMLEYALLAHVGAVGAPLIRSGVQKPGIIHNAPYLEGVMMIRAESFIRQGGFDITFERIGYVEAFTVLLSALGRYNVVTPYAQFSCDAMPQKQAPTPVNQQRLDDIRYAWNMVQLSL